MGWSGSLSANSAVGSAITYTPDITKLETSTNHTYTVGTFKAPKKGVYKFYLKGSGGYNSGEASGAAGGATTGYLLLEANQIVYVGAGARNSAAFVSKVTGSALKNITKENLYFVAGAGGGGGSRWNNNGGLSAGKGGAGGGSSGAAGASNSGSGGNPGTQTGPGDIGNSDLVGKYGEGGKGNYWNSNDTSHQGGDGGDGFYGGSAGGGASGGGGGSGYIHTTSIKVGSKTYTNSTTQGSGAAANTAGSVVVTYYARAELPVIFNGTTLEKLIFNGVEIESLIYNGTKLFFKRLRKEIAKWSMWTKAARFLRALT